MAALLVGSYTRPGQTILSVGDDVALAGAAGAGGRTYRAVHDPCSRPDGPNGAPGARPGRVVPGTPASTGPPAGVHRVRPGTPGSPDRAPGS
jgi:hypothetical protein